MNRGSPLVPAALQGMLPPQLQDHERVRAQLNAALTAMNMAMEGQRLPPVYAAPKQQPAQAPLPDQPPLPAEDPLAGSRWASGVPPQLWRTPKCTGGRTGSCGGPSDAQEVDMGPWCGACRCLGISCSKRVLGGTVPSMSAVAACTVPDSAKDPVPRARVCEQVVLRATV